MLTYGQAIILGILQGITELFPVSSLGHSVILPQLLGWTDVVVAQSAPESYFLAFLVGLHVATALALLVYYRATWKRIGSGLLASVRTGRIATPDQRLGWLLVTATIPAGLAGLLLEHSLRVIFARPLAAAVFLVVNGLILLFGEWVRRRAEVRRVVSAHALNPVGDRPLGTLEFGEAGAIGVAQVFALLPGISRSGITMVAGLAHEDAARFSFLLATAHHPRRRPVQAPGPARSKWRRRPSADPGREHRSWSRSLPVCPLPDALLHDAHAHAVRDLLPGGGDARDRPVRVAFRPASVVHSMRERTSSMDRDRRLHRGVDRAVISERAGLGKRMAERGAGPESVTLERAVVGRDSVGRAVAVGPRDLGANRNRDRRWLKAEVGDRDGIACRGGIRRKPRPFRGWCN
jgi:undecaprenyl-diphosphatase